jgi:spore coat protein U-like protein
VTYPASFNVVSNANTMAVQVAGAATGTLANGTVALPVGGTLTVGANQAAGSYTGTYTMTVEYN